jgi:hypothetical protein
MSLFARKTAPRTAPTTEFCFLCSQGVETRLEEHYITHLIPVTDNNGNAAYTFECPRCGPMDQAWGGGRLRPESNAASAVAVHLMDRHSIPISLPVNTS